MMKRDYGLFFRWFHEHYSSGMRIKDVGHWDMNEWKAVPYEGSTLQERTV